jgi:hypothetical protein
MIISEKQIMQLMTIAREHCHLLLKSEDEVDQATSRIIYSELCKIINQQSDELKQISN